MIAAANASAGGGPENVLLLVNANSEDSRTIANHYVRLRGIPPSHVLYIDWEFGLTDCNGNQFRRELLEPTLAAIGQRRLSLQIDYIIYSSDFPWMVDMRADFPNAEIPKQLTPVASLNGATFFWQYISQKHPGFTALDANWYLPRGSVHNLSECELLGNVSSRAARFSYAWNHAGRRTRDPANSRRYFLSTMLGVTSGRGNSVDEVLTYLRRSAAADATHPDGTFYFMKKDDVRSTTRDACFGEAVAKLAARGAGAEVLQGNVPTNRTDVLGIMAGTHRFDLKGARSTLLPGAVCEHFTSLGGVLRKGVSQTPLTEFLRHGAAGASGTVIEPYAIQAKFPLPSLPLHYINGCSLAEAFYQSVSGPYQLLIVGDPLCQPWATPPVVELEGIEAGDTVSGTQTLKPSVAPNSGRKVRFFEVHVDGRLHARFLPGKETKLDTTKLDDGYHELVIVGVDASPVESQGRLVLPVDVRNGSGVLEFSVSPADRADIDSTLRFDASQAGATAVAIYHNSRLLGQVEGPRGEISVPARSLGRGPVAIQAKSEGEQPVISPPIWLEIH